MFRKLVSSSRWNHLAKEILTISVSGNSAPEWAFVTSTRTDVSVPASISPLCLAQLLSVHPILKGVAPSMWAPSCGHITASYIFDWYLYKHSYARSLFPTPRCRFHSYGKKEHVDDKNKKRYSHIERRGHIRIKG